MLAVAPGRQVKQALPHQVRVCVSGDAAQTEPLAARYRSLHGVAVESYERAVDAHIKHLRRKLEPDPRHPRYVLTAHGVGYRFTDDRT